MQLHCREDYLTRLALHQTANVEAFHSLQALLFITFSSLIGTNVLYIARVVAGTCKQSQITWGCFPTFFFFVWHFLKWSDLHLPEVMFHAWLYCFTLCEETRAEHERPMALSCETEGYERRAGTSLGDKTIIMLNMCHALKAVPCLCMLTVSNIYGAHIDTNMCTAFLCKNSDFFCIHATASSYLQAIFSHFYISMLKIDSVNVGIAASPS